MEIQLNEKEQQARKMVCLPLDNLYEFEWAGWHCPEKN